MILARQFENVDVGIFSKLDKVSATKLIPS